VRAALLGGPGASGLNLASSKLEVAAVLTAAGAGIDAALAQYRLAFSTTSHDVGGDDLSAQGAAALAVEIQHRSLAWEVPPCGLPASGTQVLNARGRRGGGTLRSQVQ